MNRWITNTSLTTWVCVIQLWFNMFALQMVKDWLFFLSVPSFSCIVFVISLVFSDVWTNAEHRVPRRILLSHIKVKERIFLMALPCVPISNCSLTNGDSSSFVKVKLIWAGDTFLLLQSYLLCVLFMCVRAGGLQPEVTQRKTSTFTAPNVTHLHGLLICLYAFSSSHVSVSDQSGMRISLYFNVLLLLLLIFPMGQLHFNKQDW